MTHVRWSDVLMAYESDNLFEIQRVGGRRVAQGAYEPDVPGLRIGLVLLIMFKGVFRELLWHIMVFSKVRNGIISTTLTR